MNNIYELKISKVKRKNFKLSPKHGFHSESIPTISTSSKTTSKKCSKVCGVSIILILSLGNFKEWAFFFSSTSTFSVLALLKSAESNYKKMFI